VHLIISIISMACIVDRRAAVLLLINAQ
jgi:hypothetical protein